MTGDFVSPLYLLNTNAHPRLMLMKRASQSALAGDDDMCSFELECMHDLDDEDPSNGVKRDIITSLLGRDMPKTFDFVSRHPTYLSCVTCKEDVVSVLRCARYPLGDVFAKLHNTHLGEFLEDYKIGRVRQACRFAIDAGVARVYAHTMQTPQQYLDVCRERRLFENFTEEQILRFNPNPFGDHISFSAMCYFASSIKEAGDTLEGIEALVCEVFFPQEQPYAREFLGLFTGSEA